MTIEIGPINVVPGSDGPRIVPTPHGTVFRGRPGVIASDGDHRIMVDGVAVSLLQFQVAMGLHNTFLARAAVSEALDRDWQFIDEERPLESDRWGTAIAGTDYEMRFSTEDDARTVAALLGITIGA